MADENLRLRYPGFILFIARIISVMTGFLFTIIATRNLSSEEFGVWGNIGDLLTYFTMFAPITPFWATRFFARGRTEAAKTSVVVNTLLSFIMTAIYFIALPLLFLALNVNLVYVFLYMISSLQIIEAYAITALEAILHVKKPQMIGYGFLIFEACKVAIAFTLIQNFKITLSGAISAIVMAYVIQIGFYLISMKDDLKGKINWSYIKEWIKGTPFSLYNNMGDKVLIFPLLLLFASGGEDARAYYGAAQTFSTIISYACFLSFALYPRLLLKPSSEDAKTALKTVLMFAIPMTTGVIVLSESYAIMLNPIYKDASLVMAILSIGMFFFSISVVFHQVTLGIDKFDEKAKISFKEVVESKTFKLFSLPYIISAIIIPATYIALSSCEGRSLISTLYVSVIMTMSNIALAIGRYLIARENLASSMPIKAVAKYIASSLIMALILVILPHPTVIRYILVVTILGATVYFGILYLIDEETRSLVSLILREIKSFNFRRG